MHPKRMLAIGIIGLVLLMANGFAAPTVWAFTVGPRVAAYVTGCASGTKYPRCQGMWTTPDGVEHRGEVPRVGGSRIGKHVDVRVGPSGQLYQTPDLVVRLFWAALADLATLGALGFVAVISLGARRRASAFEAATGTERLLWRANKDQVTDRHGTQLWLGHRDGRRLDAVQAANGLETYRVHRANGVLRLDHQDGRHFGRIEAQHYSGKSMSFMVFDGAGVPHALIANLSVLDPRWTVTTTDGTHCADFIVGPGHHRLAFTPAAATLLYPLMAAFLLDCHHMLLEAADGPHRSR